MRTCHGFFLHWRVSAPTRRFHRAINLAGIWMDVLGDDDIDHAEPYSREASQVRLAVQGMDRVVRLVTRKPMLGEPRGEPPYKTLINNDDGGPGGTRTPNQAVMSRRL
jgi:hypothetical protein